MARSRYQYPDLGQIVLGAASGVGALADRRFDREHRKAKLALENKKYDESVRQFDIRADQIDREADQADTRLDLRGGELKVAQGALKIDQEKWKKEKEKYDIAQRGKEAQIKIDAFKRHQLLNSKDGFASFDKELTLQALSYGDVPALEDHIKNMAKEDFDFPDVPNEQMEIRRDQAEDGTILLTLHAKGKDGEDLVFTQDGLVGPEAAGDKIVSFTTEQGLNMLNDHHRTGTHLDYLRATKNPLLLGLAIDATNADIEAAREGLIGEAEVEAKSKAVVKGMGPAASRHFNSIIADANPAERTKIVREFAEDVNIDTSWFDVERPTELVGGAGEQLLGGKQAFSIGASATIQGVASDKLNAQDTRINRLQTQFDAAKKSGNKTQERRLRSELNTAKKDRRKFVQETNQGALLEAQNTVAALKEEMKGADPSLAASYQADIDAEQAKIDGFIQQGVRTPAMETKAWKELEENVISKLQELTPEETDRLVDAGEISITPEQLSAVRKRFEEADVKTVEEIPRKLPPEEALLARTIISMEAEDQDTRAAARERMDNLWGTGNPGVSYAEQTQRITALASSRNSQASLLNARTAFSKGLTDAENKRHENALKFGLDLISEWSPIMNAYNNDPSDENVTNAQNFVREKLGTMIYTLENDYKNNPAAKKATRDIMSLLLNQSGRLFAEANEGLWEKFEQWGSPDPTQSQFTDLSLDSIILDDKDNPETIIFLGPQGEQVGKIDIDELPNDQVYRGAYIAAAASNMGP